MRKTFGAFAVVLTFVILFFTAIPVLGQGRWNDIDSTGGYYNKETITRDKYTLVFISKDSLLDPAVRKNMIEAFFKVYPAETADFNPGSASTITFVVSNDYKGVAATVGSIIKFDQSYVRQHPDDIDVVTHELMHVVQSYGRNRVPGWLTEGIADYVRYVYGVNNAKAGWSLPDYKPTQSYTNAYRITARFFAWLEKNVQKDIIKQLDTAARTGTYTPEIWTKLTGKSVDELWQSYSANPVL